MLRSKFQLSWNKTSLGEGIQNSSKEEPRPFQKEIITKSRKCMPKIYNPSLKEPMSQFQLNLEENILGKVGFNFVI